MDLKVFLTVFVTIFIAELGDKTQLATMLFAADKDVNKWLVFAAASLALVVSAAIGVLAGGLVSQFISDRILSLIAGAGFVGIGCYILYQAASG
ncbi:MAG: TMEM165/GDT1 family protein [Pseudomonadota bacterium]